ncbi:hypothetical protein E2C01_019125 [Portunus trituberculatus]|uniref:Secreted protein n=1 Tax=Portunus trituberculatus TaxID=210409 RepID=A0A5B7DX23_PORTR|nr:hypothetical protein [Portunus trituberculatus]
MLRYLGLGLLTIVCFTSQLHHPLWYRGAGHSGPPQAAVASIRVCGEDRSLRAAIQARRRERRTLSHGGGEASVRWGAIHITHPTSLHPTLTSIINPGSLEDCCRIQYLMILVNRILAVHVPPQSTKQASQSVARDVPTRRQRREVKAVHMFE